MATLTDFQKINKVLPEDTFLINTEEGTKGITAQNLANELDRISYENMDETMVVSPEDTIEIEVAIEPEASSVVIPDAKYDQSKLAVYYDSPSTTTKKITVLDALKSMPVGELEEATTVAADDLIMIGTADGNKRITAIRFIEKLPYNTVESVTVLNDDDELIMTNDSGNCYMRISNYIEYLNETLDGAGSGMPIITDFYNWLDNNDPPIPWQLRKTIYRGKWLGETVSDDVGREITNKTFKGIFLGDFWSTVNDKDTMVINEPISKNGLSSYSRYFRVCDMNYFGRHIVNRTAGIFEPDIKTITCFNFNNLNINIGSAYYVSWENVDSKYNNNYYYPDSIAFKQRSTAEPNVKILWNNDVSSPAIVDNVYKHVRPFIGAVLTYKQDNHNMMKGYPMSDITVTTNDSSSITNNFSSYGCSDNMLLGSNVYGIACPGEYLSESFNICYSSGLFQLSLFNMSKKHMYEYPTIASGYSINYSNSLYYFHNIFSIPSVKYDMYNMINFNYKYVSFNSVRYRGTNKPSETSSGQSVIIPSLQIIEMR